MEVTYICDSTQAFWRLVSAALQKSGLCGMGIRGRREVFGEKDFLSALGEMSSLVIGVDEAESRDAVREWLIDPDVDILVQSLRVGLSWVGRYTQKFSTLNCTDLWFVACGLWFFIFLHEAARPLVGSISHKSPETRLCPRGA